MVLFGVAGGDLLLTHCSVWCGRWGPVAKPMVLFGVAGGDLFERVSKSEYRLTEAKCQIFMRQILRQPGHAASSIQLFFIVVCFIFLLKELVGTLIYSVQ
jgi:hypothetical protein